MTRINVTVGELVACTGEKKSDDADDDDHVDDDDMMVMLKMTIMTTTMLIIMMMIGNIARTSIACILLQCRKSKKRQCVVCVLPIQIYIP